jgi:hypothetical protein
MQSVMRMSEGSKVEGMRRKESRVRMRMGVFSLEKEHGMCYWR